MSKVLVLYYSTYGHVETLAQAIAEGARATGAQVDVKRVPETVPAEIAAAAHFKLDQQAPVATIADLAKVYGAHQDEINLPMDFLYSGVQKLDAAVFKARVDDAETRLNGAPP
eukprot:gene32070-41276_t